MAGDVGEAFGDLKSKKWCRTKVDVVKASGESKKKKDGPKEWRRTIQVLFQDEWVR